MGTPPTNVQVGSDRVGLVTQAPMKKQHRPAGTLMLMTMKRPTHATMKRPTLELMEKATKRVRGVIA